MRMIVVLSLVVIGCASSSSDTKSKTSSTTPAPAKSLAKPLYERLGGKQAITQVVDEFVGNVAADVRINTFFAKTDIPHLKEMLVEQICQASQGPCQYSGRDMKTVHTGLQIEDAHFDALVEDLTKALEKFNVPEKEKSELVGALGPMRGDIVRQ